MSDFQDEDAVVPMVRSLIVAFSPSSSAEAYGNASSSSSVKQSLDDQEKVEGLRLQDVHVGGFHVVNSHFRYRPGYSNRSLG